MAAARLCVFFLLCCWRVAASPLSVDISSAFDWRQDLTLRFDLRSADYRLTAAGCQPAADASPEVLAGLSCPWLRVGPLSPAGILREAWNPMGFQAGSDVFVERSGFILDASFPRQQEGILLMPLPRTLGVFCEQLSGGGEWAGCMASVFQRPGMSFESFVSLSAPPRGSRGEEWITDRVPFAGGKVLCGAARFVFDSQPFAAAATFGASSGETCLPGAFLHAHFGVRVEPFRLFLLFAKADSAYCSPRGERPRDASLVSGALLVETEGGRADLRLSRSVRQPEFSPRPFLADRTEASFTVEKVLATTEQALLRARVEGGRIVHGESDGDQDSTSRCAAAATLRVSPFTFESGFGCDGTQGISARVSMEATLDHHGSLAGFQGTVFHLEGGAQEISALFTARLARKSFRVTLTAGLEELKLAATPPDFGKSLRLSLLWGSHSEP